MRRLDHVKKLSEEGGIGWLVDIHCKCGRSGWKKPEVLAKAGWERRWSHCSNACSVPSAARMDLQWWPSRNRGRAGYRRIRTRRGINIFNSHTG